LLIIEGEKWVIRQTEKERGWRIHKKTTERRMRINSCVFGWDPTTETVKQEKRERTNEQRANAKEEKSVPLTPHAQSEGAKK